MRRDGHKTITRRKTVKIMLQENTFLDRVAKGPAFFPFQ